MVVVKILAGLVLVSCLLRAEKLGFFEQRFTAINFEQNKWSRTEQGSCRVYTAAENAAVVNVMRYGTSNQVPFKAAKGLKVVGCG